MNKHWQVELIFNISDDTQLYIDNIEINYDDDKKLKFIIDHEVLSLNEKLSEQEEQKIDEILNQFPKDFMSIINDELNLDESKN